ncbi:7214_t:CDS:1, partial [Racocetra persica]
EVNNDENVVIKTLINDYTTQEHKFVVNVTYSHLNLRFKHFKNSIRPKESILFVVGEIEIIQDKLYVYARDINYVGTHLSAKKQLSEPSNSQLAVASPKLIRSKLLATHRNIIGESEKVSDGLNLTKPVDSDEIDLNQSDVLTSNPRSSKRLKTKKVNELARDLLGIDDLELAKFSFTGDELQVNQNIVDDRDKKSDKSDDEVNVNKISAENNEYEKGNGSSSAKGIRNRGMGSKNRGRSTRKLRKPRSTTSTKSEVHVVSDDNHDEE